MAVNIYTITSKSDLINVIANNPPFNTDEYSVYENGSKIYVARYSDSYVIASIYWAVGSYDMADGFRWFASSNRSIAINACFSPTIAIATSKGVLFSSNAAPHTLGPSTTGEQWFRYHSFMFGKDKNGAPACASIAGASVGNIGTIYASALGETSSDISYFTTIRDVGSGDSATVFPPRADQIIVTAPIVTHPSTGTNTIDGGLLFIQCPVIPLGVVRIGDKNYATNGIMALSD